MIDIRWDIMRWSRQERAIYVGKENYMSNSKMGWDQHGKLLLVRSACLEQMM